jgi:hypothetical protein
MRYAGKYCGAGQATDDDTAHAHCKLDIVELDRPQMTIWRKHITCWITKATNTHSEYVNTYCFPTATTVARTRPNVTSYVHWLSSSIFRLIYYTNKHYDGSLVNLNMNLRNKPIYFINRTNIYQ